MVRDLRISDYDFIQAVVPSYWSKDLKKLAISYEDKNYFNAVVYEEDGEVVGFGNAIIFKESAWLGHIMVKDNYKRKGIGTEIVDYLMEICKNYDVKTINLSASKDGEMLYNTLGFVSEEEYYFYRGKYVGEVSENIMAINEEDIKEICDMDKLITGEDRCDEIKEFILTGYKYIDDNGNMIGFYIKELGEGLIEALSSEAGLELLKLKHSNEETMTVVPESNKVAIEFLEANGFIKYSIGLRMHWGEQSNWKPKCIYSRAKAFIG